MKFRVTMKDPDTLYDSINEAVTEALAPLLTVLTKDEMEGTIETRAESVREVCKAWFKYGELLTVEIDTEAKTCVVVKP